MSVREQLDRARTEREDLLATIGGLRGDVATAAAQRDAARADVEREKDHGDQRVGDQRANHEQQVGQLREELTQVRAEAREQRSRADRAEAQKSTPPSKPATT